MPPTDASAHASAASGTETRAASTADADHCPAESSTGASSDSEDTLDLRLPDELLAFFAEQTDGGEAPAWSPPSDAPAPAPTGPALAPAQVSSRSAPVQAPSSPALTQATAGPAPAQTASDPAPTQSAPADAPAQAESGMATGHANGALSSPVYATYSASSTYSSTYSSAFSAASAYSSTSPKPDPALLDHIADWGSAATPVGVFRLVPVLIDRDLSLVSRWMNDPAVAEFWELAGPASVSEKHLRTQLMGDGRSVPCIGVLEGTPMSYWEIYRADLDPLARHYPARPHDTGIHLLIGAVADRGRGLGSALLRAVSDLTLDKRPACARVVAEPDIRNTPSVAAFLSAGFRFSAEVDLPAKRAALMVRDRSLRDLL